MTRSAPTETDFVELLVEQHSQIKKLLDEVPAVHGHERRLRFHELRRLLAVHETAEEVIVHPRLRDMITYGSRVIEQLCEDEREASLLLTQLEKLDVDSAEFDAKFAVLSDLVVKHSDAEEHVEFDQLSAPLDDEQRERLDKLVLLAESVAPTRRNPECAIVVEDALTGPFAAVTDRIRDFLDNSAVHSQ